MKITKMDMWRVDENLEDTLIIIKGATHEEIVNHITSMEDKLAKIETMKYHTEMLLKDNPDNPAELKRVLNLFKQILK